MLKKLAFFLVTVAVGKEPENYSELKSTVAIKSKVYKQSKAVDLTNIKILDSCQLIINSITNNLVLPTFS